MQSLDQIRARNALRFAADPLAKVNGGDAIKDLPNQVLNHGLLAVMAFGSSENQKAIGTVFDAVACHLADKDVGIVGKDCTSREKLMTYLTREDATSETLKLATAEAMAWLAFAKRFVRKG